MGVYTGVLRGRAFLGCIGFVGGGGVYIEGLLG
jgi:hypothetical protein